VAWILGSGGLLGSALIRALPSQLPGADTWQNPLAPFCWAKQDILFEQMAGAVRLFAEAVRAASAPWLVLWAAGAGVVGTPRQDLEAEARTWRHLLRLLGEHLLDTPKPIPGTIFLASSAGGVFGKGGDRVLTEDSPCCPVSDYGRSKLLQEQELADWAERRETVGYVIGRLSNLYGPGQNLNKPQGLISQLCRSLIFQRPAHVYVPLDTIRDYLYVEDAAEQILRCMGRAVTGERCRLMKLIASEEPASVAQIIGLFSRLCPTYPRIICSYSARRQQQSRRQMFRSVRWPDLHARRRTPLALGIGRVYHHQLALFGRGQLPSPSGRRST
jgi:UDP-glucose 4-epimerase